MLVRTILIAISLCSYIQAQIDTLEVGPTAFDPQLALNNQGDALIAWNTAGNVGGLVQYAIYNKETKTFGSSLTVPGITVNGAHVAVSFNNRGEALVIWDTVLGAIQYSVYDASTKTLGLAQRIPGTGAYSINPSLALNNEGDAIAAWYDAKMDIQYSLYHRMSKNFEVAKTLSEAKTSLQPQIALNNQGDAILVWYDTIKEGIYYAIYDKTAKFGSIQMIANTKGALNERLALNNEGDAILTWNTGSETTLSGLIQYAIYDKESKAFSSVKTIPATKGNLAQNALPQVALNEKGEALLSWCRLAADGKDPLWYAVYNKISKQFDSPQAVVGAATYSTAQQIAFNDKGESIMTWFTTMDGTIQYAIYNNHSKTFGSSQYIRGIGSNSEFPVIALNNKGDSIIVWNLFADIQYSSYDKTAKNFEPAKKISQ